MQAALNFTIATPHSKIGLFFAGRREEPPANLSALDHNQRGAFGDDARYNKIRLAPPDQNPVPRFTYDDGAPISWRQNKSLDWAANRRAGKEWNGAVSLISPTVVKILVIVGSVTVLLC